jgi:hypothetical protein
MSQQSNRRPEGTNGNVVHEQAVALLKEGIRHKIPASKIAELRKKFSNDEIVDKIQEAFYDRLNEIRTRAKKFVKLIEKKFGAKGLPLHVVLKESKKYREKYNLSALEFDEFKNQYEKMMNARLPTRDQQLLVPNTNMAQLFGDVTSNEGIVVRDNDYAVVEEIIKMYTMTRGAHSSVILQSMQYESCATEVMNAIYDSTRNNITCAVNPVLAAMFVPKIRIFETHFLYTNIAYIVKSKYNREPIQNGSDLNLLHYMIIDSNDIVCSAETPLRDIRLRCNVQNNLWNSVLAMRAGRFFDCVGNDFFAAIDECKISTHDAPDLVYAGDEGVIMKRLLAAMSFNSLLVATNPVFGANGSSNPINFPVLSNRVVSRPFLTLRLPDVDSDEEVHLDNAISHSQVYIENGMFVPKVQKVIVTKGVIIFHVPRRSVAAIDNYAHLINPTPRFTQIPSHILINERINDVKIIYSPVLRIENKIYNFVSGIILETPTRMEDGDDPNEQRQKIIIGTAAVIRDTTNHGANNMGAPYQIYSPKLLPHIDAANAQNTQKKVWSSLGDAEAVLARKGTIFIYQDPTVEP